VSQLWSYANHVFDPRQARRLFAFIGAGGLLGGIPGGQIARWVSNLSGTRDTLLVAALLLIGVIALVELIGRIQRQSPEPGRSSRSSAARIEEARGGLRAVQGSRLLRLIAVLMLVMVVVAQMVDLQFNWAVEQATEGLDQRTEVYGNFFSLMGIMAFLFQILFTRRIHRVLGVGAGMRVLPATVGVGTLALILSVGALPISMLATAWFLKLSEAGLRHSLDQATRELLFLPVPSRLRRQAKAYIDVFVQRFAKGAAAVVLLPVTFGLLSVLQVSWLTLVMVAVWIWITFVARREYIRAFRSGLKPDAEESPRTLDTADLVTVTTLVESLGSLDGRTVIHSLDLLAAHGYGRLVPPLLLRHDDPSVRRRTLEVLGEEGRVEARSLIERAIGDPDPEVRTVAIQTLVTLEGGDVRLLLLPRLNDPDLRLRSAAIVCLLRDDDEEVATRARDVLAGLLSDAEPAVRAEAARTLGQIEDPLGWESVVQLLHDSDLGVVREAIAAMRSFRGRHAMASSAPNRRASSFW
jgi:AAA family ATP:ADP antiporter